MYANPTAAPARAQDQSFVQQCHLHALKDRLPLVWPTPPYIPPSPETTYRPFYIYQGREELEDPQAWTHLRTFDRVLTSVLKAGEAYGSAAVDCQSFHNPVSKVVVY